MDENRKPEGNRFNIEELMREYGNDVLRTAFAYVNNKETAEDIFQEVFIKAYYNLDKYRGEASIKTWLIRITINAAKDYLKSAYAQHVVPVEEIPEDIAYGRNDFEEVENADSKAIVRSAVESLPETYRDVVMCIYFKEMSVAETALLLEIAEGTVKSRLSRAREMLKNKLEGRVSL